MLNHSRTIKIVISLLCLNTIIIIKQMHSRNITILIVLLWFHIVCQLGSVQCLLGYPNLGYPTPLIIRLPKVTVLLQYFNIGVYSIIVNDGSIRVF